MLLDSSILGPLALLHDHLLLDSSLPVSLALVLALSVIDLLLGSTQLSKQRVSCRKRIGDWGWHRATRCLPALLGPLAPLALLLDHLLLD